MRWSAVADAVVGVVEIPGCSGLDVAVGLEACDGVALGLAGVDYGSPTVTLGAVFGAVLAVVPFPVASQRVVRSAGRSLLDVAVTTSCAATSL